MILFLKNQFGCLKFSKTLYVTMQLQKHIDSQYADLFSLPISLFGDAFLFIYFFIPADNWTL